MLFNRCRFIFARASSQSAIFPLSGRPKCKFSLLFINSDFTEIDIKENINKHELRNCEIEKIRIGRTKKFFGDSGKFCLVLLYFCPI